MRKSAVITDGGCCRLIKVIHSGLTGCMTSRIICGLNALLIMSLQSLISFRYSFLFAHISIYANRHWVTAGEQFYTSVHPRKGCWLFQEAFGSIIMWSFATCLQPQLSLSPVCVWKPNRWHVSKMASKQLCIRSDRLFPAVCSSSLCGRWARTPQCCSSASQCFSPTSPKLASTPVSSSISNRYTNYFRFKS